MNRDVAAYQPTSGCGVPVLRGLMALAYPFLSHVASTRHSGTLAACALGTIVLMVLADGLARRRVGAWLLLLLAAPALAALARSSYAQLPLLLVPVIFVALVAWGFGRTLRAERVPLIIRIVSVIDAVPPETMTPELHRYTRNLTLAWTLVLTVLALCNLGLAALVVPDGLLAMAGMRSPWPIAEVQWSWFANALTYGLVGGFFVIEYLYRKRCFPERQHNFADFIRRLSRLGPGLWRNVLRWR